MNVQLLSVVTRGRPVQLASVEWVCFLIDIMKLWNMNSLLWSFLHPFPYVGNLLVVTMSEVLIRSSLLWQVLAGVWLRQLYWCVIAMVATDGDVVTAFMTVALFIVTPTAATAFASTATATDRVWLLPLLQSVLLRLLLEYMRLAVHKRVLWKLVSPGTLSRLTSPRKTGEDDQVIMWRAVFIWQHQYSTSS